jgi:flagellar protein FliS
MAVSNPYSQYAENQVTTASPGKLLLMTYDGAIKFGRIALDKMRNGDLYEQSANIRKVQNILLELMASLDPKADRQLTANLDGLYTYMFDRLTHANLHDDARALEEVIRIMTDLRATWEEADKLARANGKEERKAA